MANVLKASVDIDVRKAESKINRLVNKIQEINKAVYSVGRSNIETKVSKVVNDLNKMEKATSSVKRNLTDGDKASQSIARAVEKAARLEKEKAMNALWTTLLDERDAKAKQASARAEKEAAMNALWTNLLNEKDLKIQAQANQKAKLRAVQEQRAVKNATKWQNIVSKINTLKSNIQSKVTTIVSKTAQLAKEQAKVREEARKTNDAYKKSQTLVGGITSKLKRMAATYLGVMGMGAIIRTSDTITGAENKLNSINNDDKKLTQSQMDKMYSSAQSSRMNYADMMANVSKSMTLSPEAFGGNMDAAIAFQEIMGKSYAIGGASDAEMSSSMYQMIQALGSGKLSGDELRSVTEGAPLAAKEIEKFAQKLYKTDAALKDMGADGMITSEIVVAAILNAGDKINASFKETNKTFAQVWTNIKNVAIKSFEPVLQKLNAILNSPVGDAVISGITQAIQIAAGAAMWLLNIIETIFKFVVSHWELIKNILLTLAVILGSVLLFALLSNLGAIGKLILGYILMGIQAMISAMAACLPLLIIIAILAAIVIAVIWVSDSFADACGNIAGAVWVVISFIITLLKSLWNYIKAVGTNIGIAMSNPWEAAKAAFWDWVADTLEGIKWLEPALNAIARLFGMDGFTLSGTISSVRAKQNESLSKLNYVDTSDAFTSTWSDWSVKGAFNEGYASGNKWGQGVTDKLTGLVDKVKGFGGNIGNTDSILGTGGFDPSNIADGVSDTADNTGAMADSMKLQEEDLSFLKDVANMEWKKEFTTAEIKIDMSNYNTINGDQDLDGIVTKLRDKVREEMDSMANGVYAY